MRRALLAVAVLGMLGTLALGARSPAQGRALGSAAPSGAPPSSSMAPPTRPVMREVVDVDLAELPDGGAIARSVTPGTPLILDVKRRPAATPLRIVIEGGNGPRAQHDLPAVAMPAFPPDLPPECAVVRAAIEAMVGAHRVREADVAERRFGQIDGRACPALRATLTDVFQKSHPFLAMERQIPAGGRLQIAVEQMAAGGGVSARWDVTVTAESQDQPWAHANEQEWLAASVVRDIAGFVAHAGRSRVAPGPAVRVLRRTTAGSDVVSAVATLAGREVSQEIALEPHVFEPGAYIPFARAAAAAVGVRPTVSEASIGLPERLTHPRAAVLARESDRVGAWLTRRPLDPAAHEEAALIHVALALRESAGLFTDVRESVARATAHLAVSGLAGQRPGPSGRIAAAALRVLIGRQAEALPALNAILAAPGTPAEERAWARALVLRVTGDWRIATNVKPLTLFERLALFDATRSSLGGLRALDQFDVQKPEDVPDWSWIALRTAFTVDEGNMFAGAAFPATLSEMAAVLLDKEDTAVDPARITAALRASPVAGAALWTDAGATIRVLDPALWTAFFGRHLAHSAHAAEVHHREVLAVPERADAFAAQVEPYLAGTSWPMALASLASPMVRGSRYRSPACGPFGLWVNRQPERVPAYVWEKLSSACPTVRQSTDWFSGPAIPGTVVGLAERQATRALMTLGAALPALRSIAPYDETVATLSVGWAGKMEDPAVIASAFGPRKEYSLRVMGRLEAAAGTSAPERRKILEKMCEISADECGKLGYELKENGEDAAAVVAFERVLSGGRDRVRMSSDMYWLGLHYLQTGRPEDAERVARAAAETYSGTGLALLGRVLDRRGRLREAESVFQAIEERYADRRELDLFLLRAQRRPGGESYRDAARRVMERVFPAGLERVTLGQLSGPPADGVEILHDTTGVRKLGLARGDVIVAFDGNRTRNLRQYEVVREMSEEPLMRLLAWSVSRKAYVEAGAELPDRRTGSDLRSFPHRPGVE